MEDAASLYFNETIEMDYCRSIAAAGAVQASVKSTEND